MNWEQRYIKMAGLFKHPVTGNGLCGKTGGCTECGQHLDNITRTQQEPLVQDGDTTGSLEGRISGMKKAIGGLNAHLCDIGSAAQGAAGVAHGHIQHIAGMGDKIMGHLEGVASVIRSLGGPGGLSKKQKQGINGDWDQQRTAQFKGYSDGQGGTDDWDKVNWGDSEASKLKPIGA